MVRFGRGEGGEAAGTRVAGPRLEAVALSRHQVDREVMGLIGPDRDGAYEPNSNSDLPTPSQAPSTPWTTIGSATATR